MQWQCPLAKSTDGRIQPRLSSSADDEHGLGDEDQRRALLPRGLLRYAPTAEAGVLDRVLAAHDLPLLPCGRERWHSDATCGGP